MPVSATVRGGTGQAVSRLILGKAFRYSRPVETGGRKILRNLLTVFCVVTLFTLLARPAAAINCKAGDGHMAAIYELRGVMEVGSAIKLHRDGRFQYMMVYGAADELAEGCWTKNGTTVTLNVSKFRKNHDGPGFKKLKLKLKGRDLERRFDATHKGTYKRLR